MCFLTHAHDYNKYLYCVMAYGYGMDAMTLQTSTT